MQPLLLATRASWSAMMRCVTTASRCWPHATYTSAEPLGCAALRHVVLLQMVATHNMDEKSLLSVEDL